MLSPKKTKYNKYHRGRIKGKAVRGNKICFGLFGLQAINPSWISSNQIDAARKVIDKYTKRDGKAWIRIFPDKSLTKRAAETRMGSGKGSVDSWVAKVKPGTILFEINLISESIAKLALNLASHKLSVKTRIINKYKYSYANKTI
uniref:50S ribosomal protein L16 n=1 Tax=Nitzschia alba TaxID=2858 RepID=A0A5C0F2M2_NITAL|nr:50S ribosomal protein L16 [Nitzschia alba]QEI59569.1 50S ribosomal protein L16 [Nitzschia alba]